jgi:hypothetical protein
MPSSRLSARLGQLPHDVLAELEELADVLAELCSESRLALEAAAEECMAAHTPLPHEMVLLSPDLVPHILGPLEAEDGAAAAVCSQWLIGWKATNEPRRRLKQVPFDLPEEIRLTAYTSSSCIRLFGTPDGRLVVKVGMQVQILDRSMRVCQTVADQSRGDDLFAASDDSIFFRSVQPGPHTDVQHYPPGQLRRSTHDGTVDAVYQFEDHDFGSAVLAPSGLLFCVTSVSADRHLPMGYHDTEDQIIVLDAQTLQLRRRFGLGLLNFATDLAVGGDELYVCDSGNHRLQVFSLTGEHRRSIMGEWMSPRNLCFEKDRLYLVESYPPCDSSEFRLFDFEREDYEREDYDPLQGLRVLVLSLQGDILQVVTHPELRVLGCCFLSICCFDHMLMATYYGFDTTKNKQIGGVLALQGL